MSEQKKEDETYSLYYIKELPFNQIFIFICEIKSPLLSQKQGGEFSVAPSPSGNGVYIAVCSKPFPLLPSSSWSSSRYRRVHLISIFPSYCMREQPLLTGCVFFFWVNGRGEYSFVVPWRL